MKSQIWTSFPVTMINIPTYVHQPTATRHVGRWTEIVGCKLQSGCATSRPALGALRRVGGVDLSRKSPRAPPQWQAKVSAGRRTSRDRTAPCESDRPPGRAVPELAMSDVRAPSVGGRCRGCGWAAPSPPSATYGPGVAAAGRPAAMLDAS